MTKVVSHNLFYLTLLLFCAFSCTADRENVSENDSKGYDLSTNFSPQKSVKYWDVDGEQIQRELITVKKDGTALSLVEFPNELLDKPYTGNGKLFLCEIQPQQQLIHYAKQHKMSDDELMMYLSFEIQNRFSIYNDSLNMTYSPDGLIYEPSAGVKDKERFLLFFNDTLIFQSPYSLIYDDVFFGIGLTEFTFK